MPFQVNKLREAMGDESPAQFALTLSIKAGRPISTQSVYNWLRGTAPSDPSMDAIVDATGLNRDYFYSAVERSNRSTKGRKGVPR